MIDLGTLFDGRYRVNELIGSGGMSDVYLTTDTKTGKAIALKVLKEELSGDPEFVRRFRSEAQVVLNLSHGGIVRSYDVGEFCDCQYIALQYIKGKTLKEIIKKEAPLKRERAIKIALQLCDALGYAHQKHLVHRDVKPENILMESDEKPYITDFGIARFVDTNNTLTYAGKGVLGSVRYVSPEQARGEVVGPQSDIYSLGIVLYEMLTGKLPFDGENTMAVVLKQVQEPILPPIAINPSIGIALNEVVLRATQKDQDLRYQSMAEFKRDLLKALKNPQKPLDSGKNGRRKKKDKRRVVLVLSIVAAALLLSAIAVLFIRSAGFFSSGLIKLPQFINTDYDEAKKKAEKLEINLVEKEAVFDEEIAANVIVSQEPIAGSMVTKGQEIIIHVNKAGEMISLPDFSDMSEAEVEEYASELNLKVNWHYESNEKAEGTVFRQMPAAATEIERGESIDIWVSGTDLERAVMPGLVSMDYESGLQILKTAGFTKIYVQYVDEYNATASEDVIVQQSRVAGDSISLDDPILLGVRRKEAFRYSVNWAINIDIEQQESEVIAIYKEGEVYVLAFNQIMAAGKQTLSMKINADDVGEKIIQVYVNQALVREDTIKIEAE